MRQHLSYGMRRYADYSDFTDSRDGILDVGHQDIVQAATARGGRFVATLEQQMGQHSPIGNVVDAARLAPYGSTITPGMTPNELRRVPQAVANPGIYCSVTELQIPLVNGVSSLALAQPKNTRVFLCIVNQNPANLFVGFSNVATAASLPIPTGGALFFDAFVPQNDISLFYVGANVNAQVFYANSDLFTAVQ